MADPVRFLILTESEAALLNGMTYVGHALKPIKIWTGTYAGRSVLPLRVLTDAAHEQHILFLMQLAQGNVDPDDMIAPEDREPQE